LHRLETGDWRLETGDWREEEEKGNGLQRYFSLMPSVLQRGIF